MLTSDSTGRGPTRRRVLRASGTAVAGTLLSATAPPAAAQPDDDLSSWFDGVENYDGIVDRTGQAEVTVRVGVQNGDGPYGFGPPAIRVSPGTTVIWEWTGEGGSHNVVATEGSFKSELVADAGHTFSHTFEAEGTYKYVCEPHRALGMKGAIVVGEAGSGSVPEPDYDGWFSGVDNYDATVDKRGQSEVTVKVGVQNGEGAYGFGPPAVRVSPGTTVVWEWTGEGGSHNVVATDGSYESELVAEPGHTFSHTFDDRSVSTYFCEPHRALGMKGAIVVGDVGADGPAPAGPDGSPDTGTGGTLPLPSDFAGWAALVFGGTLFLANSALLGVEGYSELRDRRRAEAARAGTHATEAPSETPAVEIDEGFDPVGTAALVAGYFLLVALLWVFMYFVEYLSGVTIIG